MKYLRTAALGICLVFLCGASHLEILARRAYDKANKRYQAGAGKSTLSAFREIVKKYPHTASAERAQLRIADYYVRTRDARGAKSEINKYKKFYKNKSLYPKRNQDPLLTDYQRQITVFHKEDVQYRIDSKASPQDTSAVHLVRPGMTKDEVKKRVGPPEDVRQYSVQSRNVEVWVYGNWQIEFGRSKIVSQINRREE